MKHQKGFTLIELLVVIAILGVIAAVVVLNISDFFGRGTVQAANIELHQVQTAIIACMAECETDTLTSYGWWTGNNNTVVAACNKTGNDAALYVYGQFRAAYQIDEHGKIVTATLNNTVCAPAVIDNPWNGITWNSDDDSWQGA